MADQKITALTANTTPATTDLLPMVDDPSGTPATQKITISNLLKVIDALTADTAPAAGDEVVTYDVSASGPKKLTLENLFKIINGLTADSAPDISADYIATYDASASGPKKVLLNAVIGVPHPPEGRLSLVTATPVMTSEQAAKTTIYYGPYKGDLVPIYSGTWKETTFTELSLALDSNSGHTGYHQSGKNFDLFVYDDSGTLRLVSGPAWTNDTTRATALEYKNGILMNAASMTGRFGSSSGNTVTVAQDRGTYVGTFRASADGTTTWEVGGTAAGGDAGNLFLWNCYNRVNVSIAVRDSTDSWTYGTATWRSLNNSTTHRVSFIRGLDEDSMWGGVGITISPPSGNNGAASIGLDSTSAVWSQASIATANASGATNAAAANAIFGGLPGLGFHYLQALEYSAAASSTFWGDAGTSYFQEAMIVHGLF